MGWYKEENLNFLSTLEMVVQGYEVDPDYFPVISCEDLKTKYKNETIEEYYKRTGDVIGSILSRHTKSPCNILFVVHAPTLDAGSRFLTKKTANVPDENNLKQVGVHYPFGSVVALEENKSDNTWKLMHCALPSISFLDCTNRRIEAQLVTTEEIYRRVDRLREEYENGLDGEEAATAIAEWAEYR
ncbi:Protein UBASH3A -like protein [Trichinella nativa]|uniref:Protein UBASH3A-like protein n=1 Tax=Trichinella nativa TaxID=6335 RepID=A0A0V1KKN7_9BILA|nr:Protein UBASH3A -like protein [Trichinella nativa]